jgi:hypothetical protein
MSALKVERYHWLNTIVGILDQAFHLTEEEQVHVLDIVNRLLDSLAIPERGQPQLLPPQLLLEMSAGLYSSQLAAPREVPITRTVRLAAPGDIVVSIEAWVEALLSMLTTAYPDLSPTERIVTAKVLADLLDAIGVPDRAAVFFPDDVVRAALEVDA